MCDDGNEASDDGCDGDCQPSAVIALDGGSSYFCALSRAGSVFCWGRNDTGQLGIGTTEDIGDDPGELPITRVNLRATATAISAGGSQTCALLAGGEIACWGAVADDIIGDAPGEMPPPPVPLGDGEPVQVTTAGSHTCALIDNGDVRCWGRGVLGTLGHGGTDDIIPTVQAPAPDVDLGALEPATIACGLSSCCASEGTEVLCWGSNSSGMLGTGATPDVVIGDEPGEMPPDPVGVNVLLEAASLSVELSACEVTTMGDVRCWGSNSAGQLGTGDTASVFGGAGDFPVQVDVGSSTVALVSGVQGLCVLSNTGDIRCLGTGFEGANGAGTGDAIGDDPGEVPPTPLELPAPAIVIGSASYASCAWLENSELWCWGRNDFGQLGQGNRLSIGDDEAVMAGQPVPLFGR